MQRRITIFRNKVYNAVSKIPRGETQTYKWVAGRIGSPRSARAVGQALNKNPYLGRVPCHRVVRSDGSIGEFSGGVQRKRELLRREGVV